MQTHISSSSSAITSIRLLSREELGVARKTAVYWPSQLYPKLETILCKEITIGILRFSVQYFISKCPIEPMSCDNTIETTDPMIRAPAVLIFLPSPSGFEGTGDLENVTVEGVVVFDILRSAKRNEKRDECRRERR